MFNRVGYLRRWLLPAIVMLMFSVSGITTISAQTFQSPSAIQTVNPTPGIFTQVYQNVSPSVVAINVIVTGRGQRVIGSGSGSGFVIDREGHIITNNHVVSRASSIEVEFFDGTLVAADIVGLDPASDLAVLVVNVPAEKLVPVTFGDSDALVVGETVLAIGSPFGQNWTLTTGIVSGLDRVITGLTDFAIGGVIQTDAAINPGNSGGPLLNLNGELVGVNSQILSQTGSNSGVGFAIPSNLVRRVGQDLIVDGTVNYSYIGISGTNVTLPLLETLGLSGNVRGVMVTGTTRGSRADQAGLQSAVVSAQSFSQVGDIITAVDGARIKSMDDLISFLARNTVPGQAVTLTILRNGSETINLPVTLSSRP